MMTKLPNRTLCDWRRRSPAVVPDDLREQPTDYLGNTYTKKLRCNLPCLFLSNHQFARLEFKLLLSQRLVGSYMFSWGGPTLLFEFLSQNLRSWPVTFKLEWFESRKHILYPKMCFLVELFFLVDFYIKRPYTRYLSYIYQAIGHTTIQKTNETDHMELMVLCEIGP